MSIKILVNGATGRMGRVTVAAINETTDLVCVATPTRSMDLSHAIQTSQAQVVIDFTAADVVYKHSQIIIAAGAHPVIGSSGLSEDQIESLTRQCEQQQLGGIIAPNFSIGAILMMKYAQHAAQYFKHAEIIELHHDAKKDAPSGTAIKTAQMMAEKRTQSPSQDHSIETIKGARGAKVHDIAIHSVRLPSLCAHQKVIFGEHDEVLEIRHDSFHRRSFMPGVLLACREVIKLKTLIYGLEHLV